MDSLCGTFSQFQSGPKPELAEFGNRAATTRSVTAIAAHRTSAMRSRWLIGAYGQIIFLRYHIVDDGCIIPKLGAECRFGSKADIATVRLKCPLYPQKQTCAPQQFASLFDHLVARRSIVGGTQCFCS